MVLGKIDEFFTAKEFFDYGYQQDMAQPIEKTGLKNNQEIPKANTSDYLVAFSTQNHSYCVGCVDMVDSTKISASIPPSKLTAYYEIFLNSMAKIISKFGGVVFKNVGDCLLYYFPESKDSKNSEGLLRALDCGLVMLQAQQVISKELIGKKLPALHYRVSADYGSVLIMNTTDSQQVDLIGPPVNMCTKINRCAERDEFVIGSDLHLISKKIAKYRFKQTRGFDVGFTNSYPVYKVAIR